MHKEYGRESSWERSSWNTKKSYSIITSAGS
jgi:hypothetical protein